MAERLDGHYAIYSSFPTSETIKSPCHLTTNMPREESPGEQPQTIGKPEPLDSLHGNYQNDFEDLIHTVAPSENVVKKQDVWGRKLNVDVEFVLIPASTFTMGSKEEYAAKPQGVTLSKPFYYGKPAQWKMSLKRAIIGVWFYG